MHNSKRQACNLHKGFIYVTSNNQPTFNHFTQPMLSQSRFDFQCLFPRFVRRFQRLLSQLHYIDTQSANASVVSEHEVFCRGERKCLLNFLIFMLAISLQDAAGYPLFWACILFCVSQFVRRRLEKKTRQRHGGHFCVGHHHLRVGHAFARFRVFFLRFSFLFSISEIHSFITHYSGSFFVKFCSLFCYLYSLSQSLQTIKEQVPCNSSRIELKAEHRK